MTALDLFRDRLRHVQRGALSVRAPAGDSAPAEPLDGRVARVTQRPWLNLAPVIAALLGLTTLAAVPWFVSRRLTDLRHEIVDVTARARQLIADIEGDLALEVAVRAEEGRALRYDGAAPAERARQAALDSVAPRLGPRAAEDAARLHALMSAWYAARGTTAVGPPSVAELVGAAERLDTALAVRGMNQAARAQSLESWDVVLPSVLVPFLIIAVLAVYWTHQRMAALVGEVERSRRALARAAEEKVTLLRGLTHDLKNTLVAANGYTQLLTEEFVGPLTPKQRDHVLRIRRLIDQAATAVGDSLEIARADAGELPVRCQRIDLRALLTDVTSDFRAAADGARLTLDLEVKEELPAIETDPALVSKIVGNLLSNAIKYTPAGGRVWLDASVRPAPQTLRAGTWVAVEVCDTGPGVPPALRERIFDEFFRTPEARAVAPGAGVGLAMSRRVARLLGGEIVADGEDGKGATFTLWLPVPRAAIAAPSRS
jgi:signal transduction histidine kinase